MISCFQKIKHNLLITKIAKKMKTMLTRIYIFKNNNKLNSNELNVNIFNKCIKKNTLTQYSI